jgi:outer membrane lipoprotein SlyB
MSSSRTLMLSLVLAFLAATMGAASVVAQVPAPKAPAAAAKPAPTVADLLNLPAAPGTPSPATAQAEANGCAQCGRVDSIRQTKVKETWTPLGAGVGAGVGGAPVTGSPSSGTSTFQIGKGGSNQGLVMLGAAGGAAYKQTPGAYERPRWEVTVKLDNGQVRVVSLGFEPYVREGDRVRVSGNNVELLD